MAETRMHANEVDVDAALVRRLLARQCPQWARLPLSRVRSSGTDHGIYRLGQRLVLRLPRISWASGQPAKEAEWLPRLAPHLPLAVPTPVALGQADEGYPFAWAVHQWLPGESIDRAFRHREQAAVDLARFITALREIDTTAAPPRPPRARGGDLAELDHGVRKAIVELGDRIDRRAAHRVWQTSLAAPPWDREEVWVHGDLLPGNLLAAEGQLSAVIDFGTLNVGDPACDLQTAWNLFAGDSRRTFLTELRTDAAARLRGRGWVLAQAVIALSYYWHTNPGIVRQALHALELLFSDADE
jgi:aminoglycoside phosphotransferase (APT) family kinase protein